MKSRRVLILAGVLVACLVLALGVIVTRGNQDVDYRVDPDSGALSYAGPLVSGLPETPKAGTWYPIRVWVPKAVEAPSWSSPPDRGRSPAGRPDVRVCPLESQGDATMATCTIELDDARVNYQATEFGELPALIRLPKSWAGEEVRLQYVVRHGERERLYIVGNYVI